MKIYGLQKMTLLDFPGHVACTVFLAGCDFRCPFCHNYELACAQAPVVMEEQDLLDFLARRKGLLDGVAITGGEPCLYQDLPALLRKIREMGFATKVDTNGCHPALLRKILEEGLADFVAMDIKNSPQKYALTAGISSVNMDMLRESMEMLMRDAPDYEFRTTLVDELHTEADVEAMAAMISGAKHYFLQQFTDSEMVPFAGLHAPDREKMQRYLEIARRYVPDAQLRGVDT